MRGIGGNIINTKVPEFDGNHTDCCSDRGGGGGG